MIADISQDILVEGLCVVHLYFYGLYDQSLTQLLRQGREGESGEIFLGGQHTGKMFGPVEDASLIGIAERMMIGESHELGIGAGKP